MENNLNTLVMNTIKIGQQTNPTFSNEEILATFLALMIFLAIFFIPLCIYLKHMASKSREFELDFMMDIKKTFSKGFKYDETQDVYLNPLQAGYLLEGTIKYHHVVATILHFLDLGIISLEKIYRNDKTVGYRFEKKKLEFCDYYLYTDENITPEKKENVLKNKISISEIYIIDKVVFKYYNYVNADRIYEFYDNYDDYSKLYSGTRPIKESSELHYDYEFATKLIMKEFWDLKLYEKKKILKQELGLESNLYYIKYKRLTEYKDKLQNDTLLPERTIENVYLWGEHLIYGVAFNVCKTSIKDATDIYEGKRKV